jgi:aconitate hydratase 2/2-methylisocitrate dehydratase
LVKVAQLLKDQSALPTELWVAPPTRMDEAQLKKEGVYQTFESLTQHTEIPGCSLCMGNQARVKDNATVVFLYAESLTQHTEIPGCSL